MGGKVKVGWRYQAVSYKIGEIVEVRIHERYVFKDGTVAYTEEDITAIGNDQEDLIGELQMMLNDVKKYGVITEQQMNEEISNED